MYNACLENGCSWSVSGCYCQSVSVVGGQSNIPVPAVTTDTREAQCIAIDNCSWNRSACVCKKTITTTTTRTNNSESSSDSKKSDTNSNKPSPSNVKATSVKTPVASAKQNSGQPLFGNKKLKEIEKIEAEVADENSISIIAYDKNHRLFEDSSSCLINILGEERVAEIRGGARPTSEEKKRGVECIFGKDFSEPIRVIVP